ncbi:hypothetical protein [Candidatus Nitrosocosmicus sp. T]
MKLHECNKLIQHMLNLVDYNIESSIAESEILAGSGFNSNELKSCLNYLKSKGFIVKDPVVPVNTGDPKILHDFYKVTTKAIDYLDQANVNPKTGDTYNVSIATMSSSQAQFGRGNIMDIDHLQLIGPFLDEIDRCIDSSQLQDDEKNRRKSIIKTIRTAITNKSIKEIKMGLLELYGLINSTTSCIVLAAKIPELLSSLPPN